MECFVCQSLSGNVALPRHHLKSIFPIEKFSSYSKAVAVVKHCSEFINNFKLRLKTRDPFKYDHLRIIDHSVDNFHDQSCFYLIREAQKVSFPEVFKYFSEKPQRKKDIPDFSSKLNLFVDQNGLIRVKSKMSNLKSHFNEKCPLLLAKSNPVTKSIIWDLHCKKAHCRVYNLLNYLRKEFWIVILL